MKFFEKINLSENAWRHFLFLFYFEKKVFLKDKINIKGR